MDVHPVIKLAIARATPAAAAAAAAHTLTRTQGGIEAQGGP